MHALRSWVALPLLLWATWARAESPAPASASSQQADKPAAAKAPNKAEEPREATASNVVLTVTSPSPTSRWTMRVENIGEVPVRIVADARLLSFEITPPAEAAPADTEKKGATKGNAKKPPAKVTCTLPSDMRPSNDVDRALIVPPKQAYVETFDPRLYCFGARESAALAPGAIVVATLGWPSTGKKTLTPPLVVSPIEGVEPVVALAKAIRSEPWTLPPEPPLPSPSSLPALAHADEEGAFPVELVVSSAARLDVADGTNIAITVTVANEGPRPVTFLFRPPTVGFDVIGPTGSVRCSWTSHVGATIRELFTTLRPKGRTSLSVLATEICPGNTFDQVGVYSVRPILDTRTASGQQEGLRTFTGEVYAPQPIRLRVRRSTGPDDRSRPALTPSRGH